MPTYQQLSQALQVQITSIFTPSNFCFLTSETGRSPTFYFAKGGVANLTTALRCGRLRTMHPNGPLIDITTSRKGHLFFNNRADRETVRLAMKALSHHQRKNGHGRGIMNGFEATYRTTPQNADFHYEYTVPAGQPNRISRLHASGGRVRINVRPNQAQIVRLLDRLLGDNCEIKINKDSEHAVGTVPVRAAISDPTAYLNSL